MFARLVKVVVTVYEYCTGKITGIFALPVMQMGLTGKAEDNGIVIQTIRPFISTWHLVSAAADIAPKKAAKLLKATMNLDEPDARQHYRVIGHMTASNFFLSENDAHAIYLRQHLVNAFKTCQSRMAIETDQVIATCMDYLRTQEGVTEEVQAYLNRQMRALIISVLTGLKLTPKMQATLDKRLFLYEPSFGFMQYTPYLLRFLSGSFRERRNDFDEAVIEFLRHEFARVRNEPLAQSSLLTTLIQDKYPDESVSAVLADEEKINVLVTDPDIRLAISGILGAGNLFPVIIAGMSYLSHESNLNAPRYSHGYFICEEMAKLQADGGDVNDAITHDSSKLPYLHAFWLETLRCNAAMGGFVRTSYNGYQVDDISIPPKSIVYIPLPTYSAIENDGIDRQRFEPKRHLDRPESALHQGLFTPFGLGPRMCPATRMAAFIFKKFIAASALQLKEFNAMAIQFKTPEDEQPRRRSRRGNSNN